MTGRQAGILVFQGALLILLGNLVGIPFAGAIQEERGAEAVRAWRVAHTSLVMGGVLYVAIGAARAHILLSGAAAACLVWLLVATAYVFSFALILGAGIGARGLTPDGPPLHVLVFVCFAASVLALLAASALFVLGAYRALRRPSGP